MGPPRLRRWPGTVQPRDATIRRSCGCAERPIRQPGPSLLRRDSSLAGADGLRSQRMTHDQQPIHSARRAVAGSTIAARLAGTPFASPATDNNTTTVALHAIGSTTLTP